ncbi:octaprenyl diphosphate synthase [Kineobactrum sediminis]|uniref:Octaprenyl diphosphate synthase n=1 Tax=Kineobactrum sediminis TaxID=1905677 RepID=A0A2N5XYC4_9GAMM|nr:polyprenyl synthetase family protein [Kineobactrum sediminis]PLW81147.1 octaprenyl diphosphate synthase [Kineobactrum sediminis]
MQHIRSSVAGEIEQVNQLIIEQLQSNVPMVENVGHYIVDAGGKRLRPLLALLTGAALGGCRPAHITFAAVIEFIHTATLLHDDVVDISSLRRGRPTANATFGNAPSVLVGDFLYTRAFQLMVQLENLPVLHYMADTTNTIAEGEVLQLTRAGNATTSEQDYLDIITRKTAVLFAAACYGAAALGDASEDECQQLATFGLHLGIAFQMVDDVLDYEGDAATMGKNVGDDLAEGKLTLPLIHILKQGNVAEQELVRRAITEKNTADIDAIIVAVNRCGGADYTRQRAREHHDLALAALAPRADGPAVEALRALTRLSLDRDH